MVHDSAGFFASGESADATLVPLGAAAECVGVDATDESCGRIEGECVLTGVDVVEVGDTIAALSSALGEARTSCIDDEGDVNYSMCMRTLTHLPCRQVSVQQWARRPTRHVPSSACAQAP
jgi:hypothetical protein